uniref:Uncharacterized protein n=1 Tax=Siphoviridae sp. ctv0N24 TaxID=2826509 RepID=A0A8S5N4G7_9CAUD|nr:MAG TPA: hypothetical protein [Siphoviridae sp. ctv0N24]
MERLTERERNIDGTGVAKEEIADGLLMPFAEKVLTKLADYEDAEEQGLLVRLLVKIGDDIYKIPSKANYDLNVLNGYKANNRVYHQKAYSIVLSQRGWFVQCDKDSINAPNVICVDVEYGTTWFLTREEAEKKLEEIQNDKT